MVLGLASVKGYDSIPKVAWAKTMVNHEFGSKIKKKAKELGFYFID
jgi:hypothetical protein